MNTYTEKRWSVGGRMMIGVAAICTLSGGSLTAAVTAGTGDAFALEADLAALSLLTLQVGPVAPAQINAPAPGTDNNAVLQLNESVVLGTIAAENGVDNALVASASSDVDGLGVSGVADASATTNNLGLIVVPEVLLTPDLLALNSTTISSQSMSSGSYGSLGSVGSSVLEGLGITVAGVGITIPIDPAPNTVLDLSAAGVVGLSIILNEQLASGNGISASGMTTNAVHITFDAVSFGGVSALTGDIVIGHSESALAAVPEPSQATLWLTAAGLALFGRRRRAS